MHAGPLTELPYDQRRLIVVMQPQAARKAHDEPAQTSTAVVAAAATAVGTRLIAGWIHPALVLATPLLIKAVRSFREQASQLGISDEVLIVTPEQARALNLPLGHPQKKLVYVAHPAEPLTYIPFAQFHAFLFEHKVAEAIRLVRSLGATTISTSRVAGWKQVADLHADVPIPKTNLGANAKKQRSEEASIETTMTLNPTKDPFLPDDLAWYPHEPLWKELAEARLESGLSSFDLEVRSSEDYGVSTGLKVMIEKSGLDVGGEFIKHETTVWRLKGTFASLSD